MQNSTIMVVSHFGSPQPWVKMYSPTAPDFLKFANASSYFSAIYCAAALVEITAVQIVYRFVLVQVRKVVVCVLSISAAF